MKQELKNMFEGMQDSLLDAEMLTVYGGDNPKCAENCTEGCSDNCQPRCSKSCPTSAAARR